MKLFALIAALVVAPAVLPFAHAEGAVTATLDVTLGHPAAPSYKACDVTVPAGANVGDLLDAAVAQGCIASWESDSFEDFGRFVTCIDGVCAQVPTYWAFYADGEYSVTGIDDTFVAEGATYTFAYEQWAAPLPALPLPPML